MKKAAVFSGTEEGRILCQKLCDNKMLVTAFVTDEYGKELMQVNEHLIVMKGRLSRKGMEEVLQTYAVVIDATHPCEAETAADIRAVCTKIDKPLLRVLRESLCVKHGIYVNSVKEAAEYLEQHEGRALLATGNMELELFSRVRNYKERLIIRTLPTIDSILASNMAGFLGGQIIAMQGPFSVAMNQIQLEELNIKYFVIRESEDTKKLMEEAEAAKRAGAELLVIRRSAVERGASVEETIALALQFLSI